MSYAIYVGKKLAENNTALMAGYGDEPSSHWLELVPRMSHRQGDSITVGVTAQADLPGRRCEIPQVAETARHLRVSYSFFRGLPSPLTNGGLNEFGVAVRDVWSPSRPELVAMTPKDQTGPNYSDLARIVLERARTAREGVDIIADLIARHGYACYGGNSHMIADPDEAWVIIEFSGGLGLWVAERLGPDSIRVSRPGYIEDVPLAPSDDIKYSENFIKVAVDHGWYRPDSGPFNVNRVYGDGKGRWKGVAWMEEELRGRARRSGKIGLRDLFWAISTEKFTGDTAGYGQVVPLLDIDQSALRVMWHAPVGPVTAPLAPIFIGQLGIPPEFGPHRYLTAGESGRFLDTRASSARPDSVSAVPQSAEVSRSACQIYKRLMHLTFMQHEEALREVSGHWRRVEARLANELPLVTRSAAVLLEAGEESLAARLMTEHSRSRLLEALADAEALVSWLEVRLRASGHPIPHHGIISPEQIW